MIKNSIYPVYTFLLLLRKMGGRGECGLVERLVSYEDFICKIALVFPDQMLRWDFLFSSSFSVVW